MTFEEFFIKKKIDLLKMKEADLPLVIKLQNEYEKMGAKSFDHSRKFFFNLWRKNFLLIETPKPIVSPIDTAETPKPAAYKPRFRSPGKTE